MNVLVKKIIWILLMFSMFEMRTMGGYHDLYLNTDNLLLTVVFEKNFRVCLEYYGLDLCLDFSSPGLSLYTMVKMISVELEFILDIGMYLFVEKI